MAISGKEFIDEKKQEIDSLLLESMEKRNLTPEEVQNEIDNIITVYAIEGMEFSDEEIEMMRKFLSGEISQEEYSAWGFKKS